MDVPTNGVSELALEVADMDRAVAFWSGTLGFPVVDEWSYEDGQFSPDADGEVWATWLYVGGNTRLGLWRHREFSDEDLARKDRPADDWPPTALYDEGGRHVHFALHVADADLDDARDLLDRRGVATTLREYDGSPHRSLYFRDPDGHVVELYTMPMDEAYGDGE